MENNTHNRLNKALEYYQTEIISWSAKIDHVPVNQMGSLQTQYVQHGSARYDIKVRMYFDHEDLHIKQPMLRQVIPKPIANHTTRFYAERRTIKPDLFMVHADLIVTDIEAFIKELEDYAYEDYSSRFDAEAEKVFTETG